MNLVWLALLREALRHPWQLALTILSVAAGVAVVVGVDIANTSALSEFDRANRTIDGVATHRVVGGVDGVDQDLYRLIKVDAGILNAAPVITADVTVSQTEAKYQLMGIDPLSDFRIRSLSSVFTIDADEDASMVDWALFGTDPKLTPDANGQVTLQSGLFMQTFSLFKAKAEATANTSTSADNSARQLLTTDISWAQAFLNMRGRISYIELKLDDKEQVARVKSLLPTSVRLVDVELYNGAKRDMTRAFRINLMALGLLALVIAMFLIYSSVSFQIVRRRQQLGLFRLAGATGWQLGVVLMVESLLFAFLGVLVGLVLGYFLAIGLSALVTGTINALYFSLANSGILFTPQLALKAGAIGVAATLLSSAIPVYLVSHSPAAELLQRHGSVNVFKQLSRWVLPISLLLTATGCVLLVLPGTSLYVSFGGLFLLICALAILTPWVIERICQLGRKLQLPGNGLLAKMVILNIAAHQSRTAVAVAALSVAVSATLGVALMIDSFRFSVTEWLEGYLRSDIYITSQSVGETALSPAMLEQISTLPGVASMATGTRRSIATDSGPLTVFALDTDASGFGGFQINESVNTDLWRAFENDNAILVSEPFARHNNIAAGQTLAVPTDRGRKGFNVAAIYRDYSSDRGLITMSRTTYNRHFDDRLVLSAAVVIDEAAQVNQVMEDIQALSSLPHGLFIRSNRELRELSLYVFDQTFRVTEVLRWLAIFVSVVGIVSALMALQLERMREYATLKALGFSHWQLGGQILLETGVTGLLAGIMALPLGLVLALALIEVINLRSYGWSMQTVIAPELIGQSVLLALTAALLAGIYPAWRLWRSNILAGLRND